jgi:small subunit ribosomal protein S17
MTAEMQRGDATARANRRKTKVGRVVSDKMDKTIVVAVERLARHRVYKRVMRVTTKFKAHDEQNAASVGDRVLIEEWRPISREKRWRLVEIVGRAGRPVELVSEEPETTEALSGTAGRRAKEEAEAAAAAESATAGSRSDESAADEGMKAEPADANPAEADPEAAAGAGASPSDGKRPRRAASAAAEPADGEKPAAEAKPK